MSDTEVPDEGLVLACVTYLRSAGFSKEEAEIHYKKLLDRHHLTAGKVNVYAAKNRGMFGALRTDALAPLDEAKARLLEVSPVLRGRL